MSTLDTLVPHLESQPERPEDRAWMARALEMARLAGLRGEVPVGAVMVQEGKILAEGHNLTITLNDPTAHAEMVVIREASQRLGGWRLDRSTLYVTLEPCAQCGGAVVLARIPRLVYGAFDPKAGMAGSLGNIVQDPRLNHRANITRGVLEDACGRILREFFQARRGR